MIEPLGQPAPLPIGQDPGSADYYFDALGKTVPSSLGEVLSATIDLSKMDTAVEAAKRLEYVSEFGAQPGEKLKPEELNAKFPGLEKPFTEPMNLQTAQYIAKEQDRKRKLQETIQKGPDNFFYGVAKFGAAVLPHALDPLENAASLIAGGIVGNVAQKFSSVARAAALLNKLPKTKALIAGVSEGAIGNVLTEPLVYEANQAQQMDYTLKDSAANVGLGAVAFPAVRFAFGSGIDLIHRMGKRAEEVTYRSAVSQFLNDQKVDIQPLIRDAALETRGEIPAGKAIAGMTSYEYRPVIRPEDLKERSFFAASPEPARAFSDAKTTVIEEDFGEGIYLTDNPAVANAHSARKMADVEGSVHELDISQAKLLDLDQPLPQDFLSRLSTEDRKLLPENVTGRQLLNETLQGIRAEKLPEEALPAIHQMIKDAGYDGLRYEGGKFAGVENPPHNVVMLFDGTKAQEKSAFRPDSSAVPAATRAEAQALAEQKASFRNDALFDETAHRELHETFTSPELEQKLTDIEARETETLELMATLESQGLLTPEESKLLEKLKTAAQEAEQDAQAFKFAAACLQRNG